MRKATSFLTVPLRSKFVRTALKLVHRTAGRVLPPNLLAASYEGVPHRIHVDDQMLRSAERRWIDHYVETGREAVDLMESSLSRTGRSLRDVGTALILPCGYGRVIRHLVAVLSPDRVTAADVDRQAVKFCAREFGVYPLYSTSDLARLSVPGVHELIFVGSLLTHLRPEAGLVLLDKLAGALSTDGHLIFTTQGETCLAHLEWYGPEFVAAADRFRDEITKRGVGFVPYRRQRDYGITIHTRRYVEGMIDAYPKLRLVDYRERGWNEHQDAWFCVAST